MADKWIAEDKWNHLTGCFFFTYLANWAFGLVPAILLAIAAGLFVELYQKYMTIDNFSWKDMAADVIGITLAVVSITRG